MAEYLADIPKGPRSLIAMVVKRGEAKSFSNRTEVEIDFDVLKAYSGLGNRTLVNHAKVLEQKGLGHFNEAEYGVAASIEIYGSNKHVGWEFFELLAKAELPPATIDRAIQDLEFTALDG